MTEEIKELLDILNKVKDYDDKRYFISCGENDYLLDNDEIKCLLNYITNLQQENEKLKQINEELKQSKLLNIEFQDMEQRLVNYKQRNEKAIKLLKEAGCYDEETKIFCDDIWDELEILLNILQGGD